MASSVARSSTCGSFLQGAVFGALGGAGSGGEALRPGRSLGYPPLQRRVNMVAGLGRPKEEGGTASAHTKPVRLRLQPTGC